MLSFPKVGRKPYRNKLILVIAQSYKKRQSLWTLKWLYIGFQSLKWIKEVLNITLICDAKYSKEELSL